MGKPLNVYDMASKGVNTTKSPIHLEDGELREAQNFQTDPALADGAIRRRDALQKLNSSALAGTVQGFIALPHPDEFTVTRTFYAPIDNAAGNTNTWRTSTNGSSWATITTSTLRRAAQTTHSNGVAGIFSTSIRGTTPWVQLDHKIYFPGDDYTSSEDGGTVTLPTLYSWDGTTETKLLTIPRNPNSIIDSQAIVSIVPYSADELLISTHEYDGTAVHTRVLLYSLTTGELTQLGPETDLRGSVIALIVYQGRIWICPTNFIIGATVNVSWVRPGDAAWTTDVALPAAAIGGVSMVEFLGDLYLGTHSSAATDASVRKRAAATTAWTEVLLLNGSGTGQYVGPFIKTADNLTLLAYFNNADGTAPLQRIVKTTDGTSWSTDLDIVADLGAGYGVSGTPFLDSDGSIYWPLRKSDNTGFIKKRTSAGTWSTVDTINDLRGPLLALKTV